MKNLRTIYLGTATIIILGTIAFSLAFVIYKFFANEPILPKIEQNFSPEYQIPHETNQGKG